MITFKKKNLNRNLFIGMYLMPPFLLYLAFVLYPNAYSIYLSFFYWNGFSKNKIYVGVKNFVAMLKDENVAKALHNNIYFAFWTMIIVIVLALFFAVVLVKKNFRENKFYKVVFFFPNIMSVVIVSLLWLFIYNPSFGLLNETLKILGLEEFIKVWLGELGVVRKALIVPQVWSAVGFYMLIYIASLQNIPKSIFEAAVIDGADEINQFFSISLPLIWNNIKTTIIYFIATSFSGGFALINIMTNGGPNGATEVLATYMYKKAFSEAQFGYGAAVGSLILVLSMSVYLILTKVVKSEIYEY